MKSMMDISRKEKKCVRYLTKEMSKADSAIFEIELTLDHELKLIYESYKLIWDNYSLENEPINKRIKEATPLISNNYSRFSRQKFIKKMALAFSFVALTSVGLSYYLTSFQLKYTNHIATSKGERQTIYLPDSTRVELNSLSEIKFPNKFKNTREVFVEGEVYFDVTHNIDKPFIVHTEDIDVQVLGTAFNVNTYSTNKTISLERGKVNVMIKNPNNQLVILPNEQVVFNSLTKDITKKNFNPTKVLAWKENTLIFDNILFKDAIKEINMFYGVTFILENSDIENKRLTGAFEGQTLKEFISTIEFITDMSVNSIGNNQYLINQK